MTPTSELARHSGPTTSIRHRHAPPSWDETLVGGFIRLFGRGARTGPAAPVLAILDATTDGGIRLLCAPWVMCQQAGTCTFDTLPARDYLFARPEVTLAHASAEPRPEIERLQWIKQVTGLSWERVAQFLAVSRQTPYLWENGKAVMNDTNRRHLLAVCDVLERASVRYPTPEHLGVWLDKPSGTDARTPAQMLQAGDFDRARFLAVASPSARVAPPPAWVNRVTANDFRAGSERRMEPYPPTETES
jgi:hypothetical protein